MSRRDVRRAHRSGAGLVSTLAAFSDLPGNTPVSLAFLSHRRRVVTMGHAPTHPTSHPGATIFIKERHDGPFRRWF